MLLPPPVSLPLSPIAYPTTLLLHSSSLLPSLPTCSLHVPSFHTVCDFLRLSCQLTKLRPSLRTASHREPPRTTAYHRVPLRTTAYHRILPRTTAQPRTEPRTCAGMPPFSKFSLKRPPCLRTVSASLSSPMRRQGISNSRSTPRVLSPSRGAHVRPRSAGRCGYRGNNLAIWRRLGYWRRRV